MKKFLCSFFFLMFLSGLSWSQSAVDGSDDAKPQSFSHARVFMTGAIPYAATYVGVSARVFFPVAYADKIFAAVVLAGNIPHCVVDPLAGIADTAISAGAFSAGFALADYPQLYGNQSLANSFATVGLNTSFWSYYQGYAKARSLAAPGTYTKAYRDYSFRDLYLAPYDPAFLSKPSVWLPPVALTAGKLGLIYMSDGFRNSVWSTGKAYVGNREIPILLGLVSTFALSCFSYTFTGIGEEALFRGTGYEEMKVSFGVVPAKLVDAVGFPACHIPQEVQRGLGAPQIAVDYGIRALITLGLQWAYDDGGLEYSVAQHMWIDTLTSTLIYLCYAGTENNNLNLSLSCSFPL